MQILYPLMQWKPHSRILNMTDNFDTKCKAWFKRSSSAQVTLPTEVSFYLKINNSKDQILTQFMHRSLWGISTSQKQRD